MAAFGGKQAKAAGKAADAQVEATEKGIEEQRRQFDLSRLDFGPQRFYGSAALRQLAGGELGLPDLGPISYDQKTGGVGLWSPETASAAPAQPGQAQAPLAALGTAPAGTPTNNLAALSQPAWNQPHPLRNNMLGIGSGEDRLDPATGNVWYADGSMIDREGVGYNPYNLPGTQPAAPAAPVAAAPGVPQVPPYGQVAGGQIQSGFRQSPGYLWQLNQGLKAVDRGSAAKGLYGSGARSKGLMEYATGLASQDYGNYYNRIAGIAGAGQTATTNLAQLGAQNANNVSNMLQQGGAARASGYVGAANARTDAFNNLVNTGMTAAMLFSDRNAKQDIRPVDPEAALSAVENVPVSLWKYQAALGDGGDEHIGPMAQDVRAHLGIGDGTQIPVSDLIGTLMAAVQALSARVRQLEAH